jgi:prepilin-type processing-associated H-X9-DG protein
MSQSIGESPRLPHPGVRYLFKPGDCDIPPSDMFVFIEEHEDSIDDGFFLMGPPETRSVGWANAPAARHRKSCQLVFVDGHTEKRRWVDARTLYPVTRTRLYGVSQANSKDVAWLFDHAIFLK